MSSGLFALICPDCGTELRVDPLRTGSCSTCGQTYLTRFGHLIPVGRTTQPADSTVRPSFAEG